jgi:DNA ligase-associated metallophosphoesterase
LTDARRPTLKTDHEFDLCGVSVIAGHDSVLYLPLNETLIVSDMHFEKGSAYAARGQMLPPYDTRQTLRNLRAAVERLSPRRVVALGDSFHDLGADKRMDRDDAEALLDLVGSVEAWVWIEGNHDPAPPPEFGGEVCETLALEPFLLRHEPTEGVAPGEIAGHLHPCAKVRGRGRSVRSRCFATDGQRLVMPAFGAFTGGLNIRDDAFLRCFGTTPDALVMGQTRVHAVPARHVVGDRVRRSVARSG